MANSRNHTEPMVQPRYTGMATFMRAPHTEDLSEVDIGMIGVPFDCGVTNRPGARHGVPCPSARRYVHAPIMR